MSGEAAALAAACTAVDPAADRLIPLDEAAQILGVERETLWYWRHRGEGPASFVVGRRKVVYRASILAAYIAKCEAAEQDRT